jgi:asparagine N-glycosylation enzyme membrane subunit Stt3
MTVSRRRYRLGLVVVCIFGAVLRLGTWSTVFTSQGTILDGTDAYYHLRRAWLTLRNWPWVPQHDHLMNVPDGAPLLWAPLYDLLLATLAGVLPASSESAVELAGAILPPILGVLQILVLALLLRRLAGRRAALVGAGLAALLPGVVRFTLLGASDHDPLIELATLGVLAAFAGALTRTESGSPPPRRHTAELALWLAVLTLTWPGALLHFGLFTVVAVASAAAAGWRSDSSRHLGECLGLGGFAAALLVLPVVLDSIWTSSPGATFEGLSWLQEAALLGLSLTGSLLALAARRADERRTWLLARTVIAAVALGVLLPICLPPLFAGLRFLGRSEPWLQAIAESRPLLSLHGRFDLRPLWVRLSLLPLLLPVIAVWLWRRKTTRVATVYLLTWAFYALLLALHQARYSHGAALALAAVAAFTIDGWLSQISTPTLPVRGRLLGVLILLPCLAAYLPVPGFAGLQLFGRIPPLITSGMHDVCLFLRSVAPPPAAWEQPDRPAEESVLAPWGAGHWIEWIGQKATIASPFGSHGQPSFDDAVKFAFLEDDEEIAALIERRRVRWVVVETDLLKLEHSARMANVDPEIYLGPASPDGRRGILLTPLMETIGARLAFADAGAGETSALAPAPPAGFHEVFRSPQLRQGPFGPVPMVRVYETDASFPTTESSILGTQTLEIAEPWADSRC